MDQLKILPDMKVTVDIELNDGGSLSLKSAVEEVMEDGSLIIDFPMHKGYHYSLSSHESITLCFVEKSNRFILPASYVQRITKGSLVFAQMKRLGEVTMHQRRNCYRLPITIPIKGTRLEKENLPMEQSVLFDGRMIDLSDSGMLFSTNEEVEAQDKIVLYFSLSEKKMNIYKAPVEEEAIEARVVRTMKSENPLYAHNVAVEFCNVDSRQNQRLYKFIVDKQLERRRKYS